MSGSFPHDPLLLFDLTGVGGMWETSFGADHSTYLLPKGKLK